MDRTLEMRDLITRSAKLLPGGVQRRRYGADTLTSLRLTQRQAQQLFGWGRDTLRKALRERHTGLTCVEAFRGRGRKPAEFHWPHLLQDLKDIVQDPVQTEPTFQTTRLYCRLTAAAVRRQLLSRKGDTDQQLPTVKTITDQLIALGFRLRKLAKCRPQKSNRNGGPLRPCQRGTPTSRWAGGDAATVLGQQSYCLAQKYQWTVVLVYYPPYHRKYNPSERLGILENYWRGELLEREPAVFGYAGNRTYNGVPPQVHRVDQQYAKGVKRSQAEKKRLEEWLPRKPGLEKWAIEIAPPPPDQAIK